ncbi:putative epidermal cell surface receptor isoform X2 [Aphidius gifuensis]|uniref:putative epidermal cell surface receptor isoform X2 n=1 Tax=Aphidius gifuensis TaxID=684658 RepID=UPI001CDCF339|nr:putative epidermal cell surface receptor isoform X2 [Aphidius gifuensis]
MQSQEIRITYLALVAFSLLGGDVYASAFTQVTSLHRPTPTADKSDGIVPQVLSIETITPKVINNDDVKNSTLMIDQQKPSKDTDIKKKLTINNDKYKNITKYQLTKKDKDDKELIADKDNYETTTLTIPITTMPSMMPTDDTVKTTIIPETTIKTMTTIVDLISSTIPSVDEASTELPIDTMMNDSSTFIIPTLSVHQNNSQTTNEDVYSPLLLDGEPIVDLTTTTTTSTTELPPTSQVAMEDETMSRARALNISASEPTNSLQANITDLSDVSMDNDENKEPEGVEYVVKHNETTTTTTTTTVLPITLLPPIICHDGNKTYNPGERIIHGCDEKCICGDDGIITRCEPICMSPYVRAGRGENTDPFCHEAIVGTDGCCAVLECSDSATEAEETCVFENKTINRGQRVEDGCSRVCICETGGTLKCQPRCPPNETATGMKQHDRCVALPDPRDSCCTITLCDVSLGEHEIKSENISDLTVNLTDVKVINSTAIKLKLSSELSSDAVIEVSEDNRIWMQRKIDNNGILSNLEPAHSYHVRITEGGRTGPSLRVILPAEVIKTNITDYKFDKNTCNHRGKLYKIGDEWYDECISFCVCNNSAKIECATIQCPTEFGLDVLDPTCLDWEPVPSDFTAKAPDCCPKEMRCRNNGSCEYEGSTYENWSTIPKNKTGCETTCSCEFGKINCTPTCPTVTALPPSTLNCPAYQAVLVSLPHHECCKEWMCDRTIHKTNGMNKTSANPGQYLNDMNIHPSIDTANDTTNNNMPIDHQMNKNKKELSSSTTSNDNVMSNLHPVISEITNNPMEHLNNYNGPYNPDYKPTESSVEELFHLPERNPEKMAPPLKDKSKSKTDMKKPIEPFKQHKEIIEQQLTPHDHYNHHHHHQQQLDNNHNIDDEDDEDENESDDKELPINSQSFPGPIAPNKFPINQNYPNGKETDGSHVPSSKYPNKHSTPSKKVNNNEQQYVPFNNQHDNSGFSQFSPNNGDNIPPTRFDPNTFENTDIGTSYSKKKTPPIDIYNNDENIKIKPSLPGKIKQNQRKPEQEILPGDLLNIFHNQHPGLTQLDLPPAQGHPGLYEFHQQISNQKDVPINGISNGFFNPPPPPPPSSSSASSASSSKKPRPQIIAQENEDGQTTYHIHAPDIQNSQSHLEELLAHISAVEQNSKQGPYQQQYPNRQQQQQINNNYPNGPPPPPPRIENNGDTYLNHPFAIPTPNQSGNRDNFPPGFPNQVIGQSPSDEVVIKELEALVPRNVRVVFTVPAVLIGLQARFELRYTSNQTNTDPSTWSSQLYLPPDELISTQKMEVELDNLEIATIYKVKVIVNVRDLTNHPSSQIYTVKTYEPPEILIDAELQVEQTNSSLIQMIWRKFSDNETRFIDGVQLRYRLLNASTFVRTPLIHRAITSYVIENLAPSTTYEIGISIIPFPGQKTELKTPKTILVTTTIETNPWAFEIDFDIKTVKSQEVEISWSGIPYPEDRYVNIYRAICKSDRGTEDTSTFKIAKRDSPAKTIISGLKPATRYSLWLMVYLKNGKTLQSNVKDFVTKPGTILSAGIGAQGKLASVQIHDGDYYGPLVIVAIVASLSILSTLILLMMLMKRRSSSKADISPRKTTSAYDNPSYKVEIQQETMDL